MNAYFEWENVKENVVSVVLRMSREEADAMIAAFDETSATSPSAADSREIARPVVIALKESLTE
jgi:hypothetical protein